VLHLALKGRDEETILGEDSQVEVVVIVGDGDLSLGVDANSDGIVGDAFSPDLSEEVPIVVEDFDAVGSVVTDENLLSIIDHHAIGEMKVLRAAKLLEKISVLVEDNDPHDLALHHDDTPLVVDAHAPGMLQDVGSKLPDKLAVLGVDLDLVGGRSLGDDYVSCVLEDRHSIGVEKLAVPLSHLTELELEPSFLVENLDLVVVSIGHNDVVLSVNCHSTWLCELIFQNSKLSKLAVVDHLLSLDVGLGGGRIYDGGYGRRSKL